MKSEYQILIVGGGNAGISVAAQLIQKNKKLSIGIIEPSDKHYYQPAWTLVGGGVYDINKTVRQEARFIPQSVTWIKQSVTQLFPERNEVQLDNNEKVQYQYLILAPGIQLNWNEIKGLQETLGKNNVCSNYSFQHAPYTFECIKNFKGGNAIFTNPPTPVKCGGAPQKIMYMAADYFRKHGLLDQTHIQFWSGGTRLFGVEKYEKALTKVVERGNIMLHFFNKLTEIDGDNQRAKFVGFGEQNKGLEQWVKFDMIHVTPPQSAPDFIKQSALVNDAGWVDVDKNTLQHTKYKNVFSLGDVAALPTSKTGAAVRKQAPVVVANVLSAVKGRPMKATYTGYTSCPIVTGYGKLILAEFDYSNQPTETFPFDQSKERWSMYQLKTKVLPWLYWNKILPGKM
jgi:sulfide:quinone oxidoreductase